MARQVLVLVLAAILTAGAGILGVTEALGAHPFWSVKVTLMGAVLGAAIGVGMAGLGMRLGTTVWLSAVILLAAAAAAHWGKTRFAASYAEDMVAGRLWYFGWIATLAAVCVLAQVLLGLAIGRRNKAL
ncbi:hypothetical protein OU426_10035 [Frigidibacter sp. RF13]|uniref:hypothetical protein n=1 Tax=Frigidibacter sp. RF13 TaxID=2997340 RepID=UPI0022713B7C|nr:hypothetical protein [Frigidibacter sp. RF13]MCY1127192.1 hypothetical protein [Frigidibacter sp. RF13]